MAVHSGAGAGGGISDVPLVGGCRNVEEASYWFSPIELTFRHGPLQFLDTTLGLAIDGYLVINVREGEGWLPFQFIIHSF